VEKIQREFEEMRIAGTEACATDACATGACATGPGAILELPGAVGEAELLFEGLERLADADRYERLLELEAQNYVLPRRELAWQRYFEETEIYARQKDYFEERRAMLTVCYQVN
jgi:hypothetical protein